MLRQRRRAAAFDRTLTGLVIVAGALTALAVSAVTVAMSGALRGLGL